MPTAVRRSIIAVLLLIVAGSVYGLTQLDSSTSDATTAVVESLTPGDNDKILQQAPVEIDLATGWTGKLEIAERPIPEDQLGRVEQQGKISFTPGPGKAFEFFPAGQNCATLTYWQVRTGPDQSFERRWCFTVL